MLTSIFSRLKNLLELVSNSVGCHTTQILTLVCVITFKSKTKNNGIDIVEHPGQSIPYLSLIGRVILGPSSRSFCFSFAQNLGACLLCDRQYFQGDALLDLVDEYLLGLGSHVRLCCRLLVWLLWWLILRFPVFQWFPTWLLSRVIASAANFSAPRGSVFFSLLLCGILAVASKHFLLNQLGVMG